jgi:peptide subunit release factor 1 (eRF1)
VFKFSQELNELFVDQKTHKPRFSKFVLAGPGVLKNEVAKSSELLPEVKTNIIAVHDVSSGGRLGLTHAIRLSKGVLSHMR